MIKTAICDDDKNFLSEAEAFFREQAVKLGIETEIRCLDSLELLEKEVLENRYRPDLLFLDIEFGSRNSIPTAVKINRALPSCRIAFLTNYLQYATDVYETDHFYYLIKDELKERIGKVIQAFWGYGAEKKIILPLGGGQRLLRIGDILSIERQRRSCIVKTAEEEQKIPIGFETFLEELEYPFLVRCHHSFAVNLQAVREYHKDSFELSDGSRIPISRFYQKTVREQFMKWQEIWI